MRAGNAYCQHFHDGGRCPYRAAAQDRFGAWACSMHIALVERSLKLPKKVKYNPRWKRDHPKKAVVAPRPQSPAPRPVGRQEPNHTSTLPPIQLDPTWNPPDGCPFIPGQYHQYQ